ncbi:MAG: hemolysin III family protein [Actinobacteria bacterium]|nr:hemolysin III family protein [Actinomycetota bacterium]
MKRVTLGKMQNPIRGFLHGAAAAAAVVGLLVLLNRARESGPAITGTLIFGGALLIMYTVSALYHSIPWGDQWKDRLQRVDHSMIFLVVAGTFTPIAIAALDGAWLVVALSVIWAIALTGILLKALLPNVKTWLSLTLQMVMGWSLLVWIPAINTQLGTAAVVLIGIGGLCYSVGVIIFTTKRPRLFPRSFSYHELFHVLVITGSTLHFLVIFWYAIPTTA